MIVTEIKKHYRVEIKITEEQYEKLQNSDFDLDDFEWLRGWPEYEILNELGNTIVFPIMDELREAKKLEAIVLKIINE
jgi:hypothetical protein